MYNVLTCVCFLQVKQRELPADSLSALTTGEDSALSKLLDSGDNQAALGLISTISTVLNRQARQAGEPQNLTVAEEQNKRTEVLNFY